ncbi:hypothetical protein N4T43_004051 [Salmonella enterica]|nr:hypothetical protein [Salmonella enterica]HBJ6194925.1 hypothetical protein [Salmonella enterica subsp. enterica serovar Saintpaul]EEM8546665.1 hypothetical protein [Salmonella enterica]EFT3647795.1 hypothetical protein [Salmonella enterica]EGW7296411.1 hypothetical protein [Salmonella enterica]
MENRMIIIAVVIITALMGVLGWCLWQWEAYILTTTAFWSLNNFVMFSLGFMVLGIVCVPIAFVLQPVLVAVVLATELFWQLLRGLYFAIRWLIRRRIHA